MYYILTALIAFLGGLIISRRMDLLSMFRSDTQYKDKKVLMFLTVTLVVGTFAFTYIKTAKVENGLLDVGWGWVALIFLVILGFLGPDAFVKLSNIIGRAVATKIEDKPGGPSSGA
jgi:fucose permease